MRSSLSQPGKSPPAITIGATGSPVPCQRLRRAHATSTPGTARTATRLPPGPRRAPAAPASRGFSATPVSMPSFAVSMRHQWFTHVRLLRRTPDRSTRPFPQRSPPRLLTAAACGGLGPPPDRRSRRAGLHHRHSTVHDNDLLHRHQSPFRTHRRVVDIRVIEDHRAMRDVLLGIPGSWHLPAFSPAGTGEGRVAAVSGDPARAGPRWLLLVLPSAPRSHVHAPG